jgi:hypothetical protein
LYAVDIPPLDQDFESSTFDAIPDGECGLKGEYFSNEELKGTPALVRTDRHIHFDWGEGSFAPNQPLDLSQFAGQAISCRRRPAITSSIRPRTMDFDSTWM